ncbi:MAG: hypothetical protein WD342_16235 [Verrucomicrobiales bacterium]
MATLSCTESRLSVIDRERESNREAVDRMVKRLGGTAAPMPESEWPSRLLTIEQQREEGSLQGIVSVAVVRVSDVFEDAEGIPVIIAISYGYGAPHMLLRDESGIIDGILASGELKGHSKWTVAFEGDYSLSLKATFEARVSGVYDDEIETTIESRLNADRIFKGRLVEMDPW